MTANGRDPAMAAAEEAKALAQQALDRANMAVDEALKANTGIEKVLAAIQDLRDHVDGKRIPSERTTDPDLSVRRRSTWRALAGYLGWGVAIGMLIERILTR